MMIKLSTLAASAALAAAFIAGGASAATYTDQVSFSAATQGLTTVDFNNTAGPSGADIHGTTYSLDGVNFAAVNPATIIASISSAYAASRGANAAASYGSDSLLFQNVVPNTIVVTLPNAVTAFGLNLVEAFGTAATFTITAGGQTFNVSTGATPGFFGETFTSGVNSFTISDTSPYPVIDNLQFGNAAPAAVSAAPEPGVWALLLGGVGAMGLMLRRRRSAALTA